MNLKKVIIKCETFDDAIFAQEFILNILSWAQDADLDDLLSHHGDLYGYKQISVAILKRKEKLNKLKQKNP